MVLQLFDKLCFSEVVGSATHRFHSYWLVRHLPTTTPHDHRDTLQSGLPQQAIVHQSSCLPLHIFIMGRHRMIFRCHSACNTHHCCSFVPECNTLGYAKIHASPDSKVHGANMGPTWGRQDPGGPHVGPMNLAIWEHLKQMVSLFQVQGLYCWITVLRVIPVTQWRQLLQRTVVLNRE